MRRLIKQIRGEWKRIEKRKPDWPQSHVRRIGLIAGALMLAILLGGSAQANVWVVTANGDPGDDTLRDRITLANNNEGPDTILFHESLNGITLHLRHGALLIADDLTIIGPGPDLLTIDGGGVDSIFLVDGVQVTISGMTLTGGYSTVGAGGAILGADSDITLTGMIITGNVSDRDSSSESGNGSGGGIYVIGSALTVRDSEISNNTAGQPGDNVLESRARGGGLTALFSDVEIYNTTISGNTAHITRQTRDGGGGGVFAELGSLRLEKSEVSGNTAGNTGTNVSGYGNGGGVFALDSDLTIQRSTISNNLAGNAGEASEEVSGFGGGVAHYGGSASIINSTVSGNIAGNAPGAMSLGFSSAGGGGLALGNFDSVESSTISGNFVIADDLSQGGGILTAEDEDPVGLHNTIVAGNTAAVGTDLFGLYEVSYVLVQNDEDAILNGNMMVITGSDPQLGPLTDNGGPTETHAIPDTSPAFDAGDPLDCQETDQREVPRPQAGGCDIGAFELAAPMGGLLEAFDGYVHAGTLQGSGSGKSAENRLNAMRNKIAVIEALMAEGDTAGACDELASALEKTDGQAPPPDFVTGPAASLLAADIQQVQTDLGCQ